MFWPTAAVRLRFDLQPQYGYVLTYSHSTVMFWPTTTVRLRFDLQPQYGCVLTYSHSTVMFWPTVTVRLCFDLQSQYGYVRYSLRCFSSDCDSRSSFYGLCLSIRSADQVTLSTHPNSKLSSTRISISMFCDHFSAQNRRNHSSRFCPEMRPLSVTPW